MRRGEAADEAAGRRGGGRGARLGQLRLDQRPELGRALEADHLLAADVEGGGVVDAERGALGVRRVDRGGGGAAIETGVERRGLNTRGRRDGDNPLSTEAARVLAVLVVVDPVGVVPVLALLVGAEGTTGRDDRLVLGRGHARIPEDPEVVVHDPQRPGLRVVLDQDGLHRQRVPRADRALVVLPDIQRDRRVRLPDVAPVEERRRVVHLRVRERPGDLAAELADADDDHDQHADDDGDDGHGPGVDERRTAALARGRPSAALLAGAVEAVLALRGATLPARGLGGGLLAAQGGPPVS